MDHTLRRIGALIPPGNVSVEREFARFAPSNVYVHYSRLYRPSLAIDKEGLLVMIESAEQATRALVQTSPEVFLYACTSGSFVSGAKRAHEIGEMIHRWTGTPAYTTSTAVIMGLKALDARRAFVLTPYPEDIHAQANAFLEEHGVCVGGHDTFGCSDNAQIRDIPSEAVAERLLRHRGQVRECDSVFISCTNLLTMDQIERLEAELGVPVTSANQCTLWAALTHMKVPTKGLRLGKLFDLPPQSDVTRVHEH